MRNEKIRLYQWGFDIPQLFKPLVERALSSPRLRELAFPEHALVFNDGVYRGRGQHIPDVTTISLGGNYRTRNVEKDFPYIDAALVILGYDKNGPVDIEAASGLEAGLDDIKDKFNLYREMRDVDSDVKLIGWAA